MMVIAPLLKMIPLNAPVPLTSMPVRLPPLANGPLVMLWAVPSPVVTSSRLIAAVLLITEALPTPRSPGARMPMVEFAPAEKAMDMPE